MNHLILIFELCTGGTLRKMISTETRMPLRTILNYFEQIVSGLRFSHDKKIAHLDIKPANMFLDKDNRVKIADFGLSILQPETDSDEGVNAVCGSLVYRAPEIIAEKPYDPFKADVWSVGVLLYVMAVGMEPWPTYSLDKTKEAILEGKIEIPDFVDQSLRTLIEKILIRDPKLRPSMRDIDEMDILKDARMLKAQMRIDTNRGKSFTGSGIFRHEGLTTGLGSPGRKALPSRSFEVLGIEDCELD